MRSAVLVLVLAAHTAHADDVTFAQVADAASRAPEATIPASELASAEANVVAAGAWPAPSASIATNRVTARLVAGVAIPLPLFGTIGAARGAASAHAAVVRAEGENLRRDLVRRALVAWLELARADATADALAVDAQQAAALEAVARGRLDAGAGAEVDVTAAHAARLRADLALGRAKHAQDAAAATLAGVLGWDPARRLHSAGPLPGGTAQLAALRASLARHPERVAALRRIEEAQAVEQTARVLKRPAIALDVQSSFFDPTEPRTDMMVGLTVELPVFSRIGTQVRAAQALTKAERGRLAAADARLAGDLVAAFSRWQAATELSTGLERDVLPIQDKAATLAQQAYREGARDLASALQAERDRAAVRSEIAGARIDAATAWIELQLAAGEDPGAH